MKNPTIAAWAALVLAVAAGTGALAQTAQRDAEPLQARDRLQERDRIYGSELMSEQERIEHRNRLRELKTQQEREQFRKAHHLRMQERAKDRGVKLADEPPAQVRGAGPSPGAGPRAMPGGGAGAGGSAGGRGGR